MKPKKTYVLIVTGFSGAGKSSALHALEDIGFFCVDNLPVAMLQSFFYLITQSTVMGKKIALGIDIRAGHNAHLVNKLLKKKQQKNYILEIFFLAAHAKLLLKRFQETRRKHPLAHNRSIQDAISYEKELLFPLMQAADYELSTDQLTIHQLRSFIRTTFISSEPQLLVNLVSFGFKYGVPEESNFVYDVRALPNPYFIKELQALDGRSKEIRTYLFAQPVVKEYWHKFVDFFQYSVHKSYEEGRSFINVAIGCTGGRHRSVALVYELSQKPIEHVQFMVKHRDIAHEKI